MCGGGGELRSDNMTEIVDRLTGSVGGGGGGIKIRHYD